MSESEQWQREQHDVGLLIARLLMGAMFVTMGVYKLTGIETTVAFLTDQGLPAPQALAWFAALVETIGGLAIILGIFPGRVALLLALYLVPTTLLFHADLDAAWQITHLIKNTGLIGGLIAIWASRGGRIRFS